MIHRQRETGNGAPPVKTELSRCSPSVSSETVARKSRTRATRSARTCSTSSYAGAASTSMPTLVALARHPENGTPIGWKASDRPRIDAPSHTSVANTRCRSVCAKDHSPSTETSTVPSGRARPAPSSAPTWPRVRPNPNAATRRPAPGVRPARGSGDRARLRRAERSRSRYPHAVDIAVDVGSGQIGASDPDATQVALPKPGVLQVGTDELGAPELIARSEDGR